jgi:phenylpyruvate tautomerase PptA (4-oxalocrotonate tautomerase family)
MPLLTFYTSPNQLTAAEKRELATVLTARYARAMPAFFVDIVFLEVRTFP